MSGCSWNNCADIRESEAACGTTIAPNGPSQFFSNFFILLAIYKTLRHNS